ncbi:MAG: hypothetical protein AAB930_00015 [Patescibacteria group bacterium]
MPPLTIPESIMKENDLMIISRKEYKEFSDWKKAFQPSRKFKTFKPTAAQKRDLLQAREDHKKGKYMSIDELKRKLGVAS